MNYRDNDQIGRDSGYGFQGQDDYMPRFRPSQKKDSRGARSGDAADYATGNVVIYTPKSYQDVQKMIESLRDGEPILVNFEGVTNGSAQRILDFLSGASYALGGSMRRIKEVMFLITPSGTGITDNGGIDNN